MPKFFKIFTSAVAGVAVSAMLLMPTAADPATPMTPQQKAQQRAAFIKRIIQARDIVLKSGNPDALYRWCRNVVFLKYGQRGLPAPDFSPERQSRVLTMHDSSVGPMVDYCVQQRGRRF